MDIGSSSVRGALFDARGTMIKRTLVREESRLQASNSGGSEANADATLKLVIRVIDNVLERSANVNGDITYIASCTYWHSLMGVDAKGKPTSPVYGWADTQGREYTPVLKERFDEGKTHNRTGAHFHSSFWPAKLLWLKGRNPNGSEGVVFSNASRWLSLGDYLTLKFCGKAVTSISMASGTGIFDIRLCSWDDELLRYLNLRKNALPEIAPDGTAFSFLPKWQKRWPRLANASFLPPIADGVASNIGSGCVTKEKAALMVGTSGAMRVVYEGAPPEEIPSGLWCYRVDRERVIVGGALSDGGGLYEWLKRNLRIDLTDKQIAREIERRDKRGSGLKFLPFLAGERSIGYNENATGAIAGLTMSHDAIDILQSAMEAVADRFADIYQQLLTVCPIKEIVASGGALDNSPIWQEMISDALGHKLIHLGHSEASLRGAVLLALKTTGKMEFAGNNIDPFLVSG